jgi:hypothetical protein
MADSPLSSAPAHDADHEADDIALPMRGMRVIDVSSFVAAPLGGMTLAQLGAEVIRVDPLGGAPDHDGAPEGRQTARTAASATTDDGGGCSRKRALAPARPARQGRARAAEAETPSRARAAGEGEAHEPASGGSMEARRTERTTSPADVVTR